MRAWGARSLLCELAISVASRDSVEEAATKVACLAQQKRSRHGNGEAHLDASHDAESWHATNAHDPNIDGSREPAAVAFTPNVVDDGLLRGCPLWMSGDDVVRHRLEDPR